MKAGDPSVLHEFRECSAHLRESEMPHKPVSGEATEELRRLALFHLWTHNGAWNDMAEEGLPFIAVSGKGVRIVDSPGQELKEVAGDTGIIVRQLSPGVA